MLAYYVTAALSAKCENIRAANIWHERACAPSCQRGVFSLILAAACRRGEDRHPEDDGCFDDETRVRLARTSRTNRAPGHSSCARAVMQ